jgi:hypothetical protein
MTMYGSQTILESSQAPPPNNCLRSVHCHYRSLYLIYYYNTERKFAKNPELKLEYSKFIQEYLQLVKNLPDKNSIYLPHHAVLKESSTTTRLRVVFDASAKTTNNRSLNDNLMHFQKLSNFHGILDITFYYLVS